jgi:hypothetical protein
MRRLLVSILLVSMLVVLGVFVASRHGVNVPFLGKAEREAAHHEDAGVRPPRPAARTRAVDAAVADARVAPAAPVQAPPLLDRPLRVVATHWEVAAPMLLAAGGLVSTPGSLVDQKHLRTEVKIVTRASEVEEALARGGGESAGADLAIVPLATWVAGYEHLRALAPEAFFVVAWSRGSESFFVAPNTDPNVPLPQNFAMASERSAPSALSAMLLFGEMGVAPENVHVVAYEAGEALVAATDREGPSIELAARGRTPLMTTADAARISPWVVIAPRAFQREHPAALAAWASTWFLGVAQLARDVPLAARSIAAMQDAPPIVELLRRLGQIDYVTLFEQAELFGLSGRGYITLSSLFARAWVAERGLGALIGPPPESPPIATGTIAALALRDPPRAPPRPVIRTSGAGNERVLVTFPFELPRSAREPDAAEPLIVRLGFTAGVFSRSVIRISVARAQTSAVQTIVAQAVERYAIDAARIEVVPGTTTSLHVLAPL